MKDKLSNLRPLNSWSLTRNYNAIIIDSTRAESQIAVPNKEIRYYSALFTLAQYGYTVSPEVMQDAEALDFVCNTLLYEIISNKNTTFYKSFGKVISMSREEILQDQVALYFLNWFLYRVDYIEDETTKSNILRKLGIPNNLPEPSAQVDTGMFDQMINIEVVDKMAFWTRIKQALYSNIAMSEDNVICLTDFCIALNQRIPVFTDRESLLNINNKEIRIRLYGELGITPDNALDLLHVAVYHGSFNHHTQLINSIRMMKELKEFTTKQTQELLNNMTDDDIERLSFIYNKYKYIFLGLKHYNVNKVNRISRLAKRNKKQPKKFNLFDSITDPNFFYAVCGPLEDENPDQYQTAICIWTDIIWRALKNKEVSIFRLIRLYNMVSLKLTNDSGINLYTIRTGGIYVKETKDITPLEHTETKWYHMVQEMLMNVIARHVAKNVDPKYKTVVVPDDIVLTAPVSEKQFIGNIPFMSYIDLKKQRETTGIKIGIYWRGEWGTDDFDLSFVNINGGKIGWNADFYQHGTNSIPNHVFSGDMVTADPEAAEIHYFHKQLEPGIFYCNRYNGNQGSRYRFFIAKDDHFDINGFERGKMVSEDEIMFQTDFVSDKEEQMIGMAADNKFIFNKFNYKESTVSCGPDEFNVKGLLEDYMPKRATTSLKLAAILIEAGFNVITTSQYKEIIEAEPLAKEEEVIDLRIKSLTKDSLLSLFE